MVTRIIYIVLIGSSSVLSACDGLFDVACTGELRPNLDIEVRDAISGAPAARGATGGAEHPESGVFTDLFPTGDELHLNGNWNRERRGQYFVHIQRPGFKTEHVQAHVDEDECHVVTKRVTVQLSPDPTAVKLVPLSFQRGPRAAGSPASAGIRVFGDTLVVSGRAAALSGELGIVGFRANDWWHIQLQPSLWSTTCPGPHLQQFEARFKLDPGNNKIMITHAAGWPVTLFEGTASPVTGT